MLQQRNASPFEEQEWAGEVFINQVMGLYHHKYIVKVQPKEEACPRVQVNVEACPRGINESDLPPAKRVRVSEESADGALTEAAWPWLPPWVLNEYPATTSAREFMHKYSFLEVLGTGSYGKVFAAQAKNGNFQFSHMMTAMGSQAACFFFATRGQRQRPENATKKKQPTRWPEHL